MLVVYHMKDSMCNCVMKKTVVDFIGIKNLGKYFYYIN